MFEYRMHLWDAKVSVSCQSRWEHVQLLVSVAKSIYEVKKYLSAAPTLNSSMCLCRMTVFKETI